MAIGWLTILQNVPWSEVLKNAPKVAQGAKRLWGNVARKPGLAASVEGIETSANPADPFAQLQARVNVLEAATSDMHQQLMASSELIKALSEQNAQLVEGMERMRVALRRIAIGLLAALLLAIAAVALVIAVR